MALLKKSQNRQEDRSHQLTVMLTIVSSTYIILYIPVIIVFVLNKALDPRSEIITHVLIAYNYTKVLYIFGFAINFVLYTLSGRVFREQLRLLLCYRTQGRKADIATGPGATTAL